MKKIRTMLWAATLMVALMSSPANAMIFINEILADPAAGLSGDANGDGNTSSSQDEFVELVNTSADLIDVSGWSLSDAVQTRHIFAAGTIIAPYDFLVIFGGGMPNLPGIDAIVASSGGLSFNNTGDTVSLFGADSSLIDQIVYGSDGGRDQSLTRFPDGIPGTFQLHANIQDAGGRLFSPGTTVNGEDTLPIHDGATVPEYPGYIYFCMGIIFWMLSRYRIIAFNHQ